MGNIAGWILGVCKKNRVGNKTYIHSARGNIKGTHSTEI